MMRSMYSGVSGLTVHQTKMDVIGNNIANVNTIGYKKSQASFQEAFSQLVKGAGSPEDGKGGTNPQQIGLGIKLGGISTVHTQGSTQRTDNATDLMIDGEGYFVVSDDPNCNEKYYTRAGNFSFDVDGNLVTPSGYKLVGDFIGSNDYANYLGVDPNQDLAGVKLNKSIAAPPSASTKTEMRGNLDSRLENGDKYTTDTVINDSLGNSYKAEYEFVYDDNGTTTDNTDDRWQVYLKVKDLSDNSTVYDNSLDSTNPEIATVKFDSVTGKLTTGTTSLVGSSFPDLELDLDLTDLSEINSPSGAFGSGNNGHLLIDFSKLTVYGNESGAKAYDVEDVNGQVGRESGSLTGFAIDATGKVIASFSNGVKEELWQIKTANFDNPAGLEKSGSNFFQESTNSGEPKLGIPGSSGLGSITPGALEMSNVDLSLEFTEMISTQRGFQANSRIITTTDEMLQELTNMKR